jgi:hypothetical protein
VRTQFKFLVRLYNIQINEALGRGEEIYPGMFLTNGAVSIRRLLNQQFIIKME